MKKTLKILPFILLSLVLILTLGGCKRDEREKKYLRLGLSEDAAGLNLLLIGKLAGTQKLSTYVYFDAHDKAGYAERVIEYMEDAHGLDAAYFEESDVPAILSYNATAEDPLKLIFIDSFNADGSIHGFYMARESWIRVRTKDHQRFVNGLLASAKYRYANSAAETSSGAYSLKFFDRSLYTAVYEKVCKLKLSGDILFQTSRYSEENDIEIMTTTEQFISLYEIDNLTYDALTKKFKTDADALAAMDRYEAVEFGYMSIEGYLSMFAGSPEDTAENMAKAAEDRSYLYDTSCDGNAAISALFGVQNAEEICSLDVMVNQMYKVAKQTPAAEKNYTKAIVIVTLAAIAVVAAALTFIIKKSRSGKKISLKEVILGEE